MKQKNGTEAVRIKRKPKKLRWQEPMYALITALLLFGAGWGLLSGHANGLLTFLAAPLTASQLRLSAVFAAPAEEPPSFAPTEATEAEVSEAAAVGTDDTEIPADILQMESEYLALYADTPASGTVSERDYRSAAVSDMAGAAAIRNATATKTPDFDALLAQGAALRVSDKSEPLVLIFHTHTTESYLLADNGVFWSDFATRSTLPDRNIVRIGEELVAVLRENGIGVVHDTTVYDSSYNGAYGRSREGIAAILEQNPTIQMVLDIHRDAIYYSSESRGKPIAEINGQKAAQIMIIAGAEEGLVTSFPEWEYNLRFALELQNTAATLYDGLMKPIYFCQRKYNMDISRCGLLLEIGSDANTLAEAVYSARLCGKVLTRLIENHCA